jgi:hypothetical protein
MIIQQRRHKVSSFPPNPRKLASSLQTAPHAWQFWLVAAGLPLSLCAVRLNCDLWYDEAYTIIHFVSQPWHQIVRDYSAPNNHIFYSLLLRPLYLLSGEEFLLRLPGFFFAAGTLWFTFLAATLCGGILAGCLATLWLGLTQMFLIHVMEIRGYGLSLLLTAILGYLTLSPTKARSRNKLLGCLLGFLCLTALVYTIPTNLLFGIALAGFVAVREWDPKARYFGLRESWCWFAGVLVGCALYLPVWEQLRATAGQGAGWNWRTTLEISFAFFRAAFSDWWPVLGLATLVYLFRGSFSRGQVAREGSPQEHSREKFESVSPPHQLGWLAAGLLVPFVVAGLLGIHPFVRNFLPALHFLAVGCGVFLATAYMNLSRSIMGLWAVWRTPHPPTEIRRRANLSADPESHSSGKDLNEGVKNPRVVFEILLPQLVLLLLVLPRFWTYADRLEKKRQVGPVQDGYYNYYAAHFRPSEAVRFVADFVRRLKPPRSYRVLFRQADFYPLAYYLAKEGMPQEAAVANCPEEHVFLILPAHLSVADFLRQHGGDPRTAEHFQILKDAGYYRVFWAVAQPSRAAEPADQSVLLKHVTSAKRAFRPLAGHRTYLKSKTEVKLTAGI